MTTEVIAVVISGATAFAGFGVWLWTTSGKLGVAAVTLALNSKDIEALKVDGRELRDGAIRQQALLTQMSSQLSKLDQIDRLVAASETIKATVERLDRMVVPRPEFEQLVNNLNYRMSNIEKRQNAE